MSEQENKVIDQEQLVKIEAEVKAKQAEELKRVSDFKAQEIEAKVRKELTEKAERDAMSSKLRELEEQNKKIREETDLRLKAERDIFEKRLQELESTRKAVANTTSPFKEEKPGTVVKGINVDELDLKQVEEESRQAFLKKFGLPSNWGVPLR